MTARLAHSFSWRIVKAGTRYPTGTNCLLECKVKKSSMLLYFNRAPFMFAHCLIYDIYLPVFENIYILIIVLLFVYLFMYLFLYFLKFILSIFWRTTLEASMLTCALMCLSSVNIIFICIIMFYQINSIARSLTHMKVFFSAWSISRACAIGFITTLYSTKKPVSAGFSPKHK